MNTTQLSVLVDYLSFLFLCLVSGSVLAACGCLILGGVSADYFGLGVDAFAFWFVRAILCVGLCAVWAVGLLLCEWVETALWNRSCRLAAL